MSVKYGLPRNKKTLKAYGYKLEDFTILAETIQKCALCKKCKAASSSLVLFKKEKFL